MEKINNNYLGAKGQEIIKKKTKKPFLEKRKKINLSEKFKKEEKADESID